MIIYYFVAITFQLLFALLTGNKYKWAYLVYLLLTFWGGAINLRAQEQHPSQTELKKHFFFGDYDEPIIFMER